MGTMPNLALILIDLNDEQKAQLKARLKKEIRTNTYNKETKELVISNDRADAFQSFK